LKTYINATLLAIQQATPKIKIFRLQHEYENYVFKPGQWLDLKVPIEGKNIGGYTIISSPNNKGIVELAIRESLSHPVTQYLYHKINIGDELQITEGQGNFFLKPESLQKPIIYIAGGIGITPILSMIRSHNNTSPSYKLFYSVSNEADILLRDELSLNAIFCITKNHSNDWTGNTSRINSDLLIKNNIDINAHFYICGPRLMINALAEDLATVGIPGKQIHFEKWW
jgi:ferredoxin-NADP reductase